MRTAAYKFIFDTIRAARDDESELPEPMIFDAPDPSDLIFAVTGRANSLETMLAERDQMLAQ